LRPRLKLRLRDLHTIRQDCAQRAPEEACGLLIAATETEEPHVFPCANITDHDKSNHFELDPKAHFDALHRFGRARIIGFYHSHPQGPCRPSAEDLRQANDPHMLWMIVTPTEEAAFCYDAKKHCFHPISLQVTIE